MPQVLTYRRVACPSGHGDVGAGLPGDVAGRFSGMLIDMANLSRAKDAAISIVPRELNAHS
jgi:hypothetical protein